MSNLTKPPQSHLKWNKSLDKSKLGLLYPLLKLKWISIKRHNTCYYHTSIPTALYVALKKDPIFDIEENAKYIPNLIRGLHQVAEWNLKEIVSFIHHDYWEDLLGPNYKEIRNAPIRLGLMNCNDYYTFNEEQPGTGTPMGYVIPQETIKLLNDNERDLFLNCFKDINENRKRQIRITQRGYHKIKYGDQRDDVKGMIDGFAKSLEDPSNLEKIDKIIQTYPIIDQRQYYNQIRIGIIDRKYKNLEINEKDGRIPNPLTSLPSDIRNCLQSEGYNYNFDMDMRSCHLSFFGEEILRGFKDKIKLKASSSQPLSLPLSTIVGGKPIICSKPLENIEENITRWNAIFFDPNICPKEYISKKTGIPIWKVKDVGNPYINGHKLTDKYFKAFDLWMRTDFLAIHTEWRTTDVKHTGCRISKNFESKLMLDKPFLKRAKQLGVKIVYTNDGSVFYSKDRDGENSAELLNFLEERSVEIFKKKVIFVNKTPKYIGLKGEDINLFDVPAIERFNLYLIHWNKFKPECDRARRILYRRYIYQNQLNYENWSLRLNEMDWKARDEWNKLPEAFKQQCIRDIWAANLDAFTSDDTLLIDYNKGNFEVIAKERNKKYIVCSQHPFRIKKRCRAIKIS